MLDLLVPFGLVGLLASSLIKRSSRPYRCSRHVVNERINRRIAEQEAAAVAEEDDLPTPSSAHFYRWSTHEAIADKAIREEAERIRHAEERKNALRLLKLRKLDRVELARITRAIENAADHGLYEVEVARFPIELTTDRARAVNNAEPDWAETLTGLPAEIHHYFAHRPGFAFRAFVCRFGTDGTPETVSLVLRWA